MRETIVTHTALSEKRPENVDRYGGAPEAAERAESLAARLGRILPDLVIGEDGKIDPSCVWKLGASVRHAAVRRGDMVFPVCRDECRPVKHSEQSDLDSVTCPGCVKIVYRCAAGSDKRAVSSHVVLVASRPADDPNRYRPVAGVGERSEDPFAPGRVSDESRLAMERMGPAIAAVGDGGPVPVGYARYTLGSKDVALQGWVVEALALPRVVQGVSYATGWDYARVSDRLPDEIFRALTREERRYVVRGWAQLGKDRREQRSKAAVRDVSAGPAVRAAHNAMVTKRERYADSHARKSGESRPRFGSAERGSVVRNPYPKPNGVFAEFRDSRRD
ncbi:hypothetical protein [Rhodococcus qingshengii]|uniref:hypothetical protein n=1 Tax=Rhodococcus qingshengii TaxID=334542 RepID=UPI0035DB94E7